MQYSKLHEESRISKFNFSENEFKTSVFLKERDEHFEVACALLTRGSLFGLEDVKRRNHDKLHA